MSKLIWNEFWILNKRIYLWKAIYKMEWKIHLTFTILGCGQHNLYEDFSEKGFNQKGGKVKREN